MTLYAANEFWIARLAMARSNSAQTRMNSEKWSLAQGFYINMHTLTLRTNDAWTYKVTSKESVPLIESS